MSLSDWTLRAAQAADADALAALYLNARRTFLPYAPLAHDDEAVRQWLAAHRLPAGGVIVAERAGAVRGFVACVQQDGQWWIDHLYLHPDEVGQGLGSALLQHALVLINAPVRLFTFQANGPARRFYERHGFVAIAFSDGSGNEERCPDVLYAYHPSP
ncbi:GNAT family N-acetyltransferase [Chitinimonas sp. BJYL2]|uniref:GNAT family N-acetyltransferase n=1 Tax=Chitinimonas sp. BJYL2 TaxID=2976696 RepID=UPI0022B41519|nr:GNAT family N-acetyltransferase [Chitinimonas sp. BJYL2]